MKGKRVALYARVSTDGQSVDNQLRELEAVALKEGWEIVERLVDKGYSGAKGRDGRPAFDSLCSLSLSGKLRAGLNLEPASGPTGTVEDPWRRTTSCFSSSYT